MKIANNRALAAEKKAYEMPSVIMTQLVPSTVVLAGSNPFISTGDPVSDTEND